MILRRLIVVLILGFAFQITLLSQIRQESGMVKKGWSFGATPVINYNTDMKFHYGVLGDIYYYGDGSLYPEPLHKIGIEATAYTMGRVLLFASYESKHLIPGMRFSASAGYVSDPRYNFFGFNGDACEYNPLKSGNYLMSRNFFRFISDFQGKMGGHLNWVAGVSFWNFKTGEVQQKYGGENVETVYSRYVRYGVIKPSEASGGSRLEFKAGLCYDSRDKEAAPDRGIWAELYCNGSPDFFGDGHSYLKFNAHFRHYLSIPLNIPAGNPVFAYHLAYQSTVAGDAPFYMQQNICTLILKQMLCEGMGSAYTVRGTRENRIIADGYAWSNFELRIKLFRFTLFKQYFYTAISPFFDCGVVAKPYRVEEMLSLPETVRTDRINNFIYSSGCGFKLAWNENFILSLELAHNFNRNLSDPFWMEFGCNYIF